MLINQLPSPYKEMAEFYENEVKEGKRRENSGSQKLYRGTTNVFVWSETKEKAKFWQMVHDGKHPEITEEIKSYHPEIFAEKPKQGLPEEFGIVIQNSNGKAIIDFLQGLGYTEHNCDGSGYNGGNYYVLPQEFKIEYYSPYEGKNPIIKTFTLEEARQMTEQPKPVQVEEKKIIGYKVPYDISVTSVPWKKDEVAKKNINGGRDAGNYCVEGLRGTLPKEIVETWEAVFFEEFKKGDYIVLENIPHGSESFHVGGVYQLKRDSNKKSDGFYVEYDDKGSTSNGYTAKHLDLKFRKATLEEIKIYEDLKNKVELTLGSQSDKVTVYKDGRIDAGGVRTQVSVIREFVEYYGKSGKIGQYDVAIDRDTQSSRIGCLSEDHRFSINEFIQILTAYEKLQK